MKMMAGLCSAATLKRVRTSFSPSPIHLEVKEDAEMLKNVAPAWCAMALAIRVLPVPGGLREVKGGGKWVADFLLHAFPTHRQTH